MSHPTPYFAWLEKFARAPAAAFYRLYLELNPHWIEAFIDPMVIELLKSLRGLQPFERYLERTQPTKRKSSGVYFTPYRLASAMVDSVHQELLHDFEIPDGLGLNCKRINEKKAWLEQSGVPGRKRSGKRVLSSGPADTPTPFTILDPACGTGIFLVACLRHFAARFSDEHARIEFLQRLAGIELCPVAFSLAHFQLVREFSPEELAKIKEPINLFCQDATLLPRCILSTSKSFPPSNSANCTSQSREIQDLLTTKLMIILGNPPFGALTHSADGEMQRLLRGESSLEHGDKGYVGREPTGNKPRKMWLHDLYVQFLRLAHWLIDRSEAGIISFVCNANFQDNLGFSQMRVELLRTFQKLSIQQPNSMLNETTTQPFKIRTPVSVVTLIKRRFLPSQQENKMASLCMGQVINDGKKVTPIPPHFRFTAANSNPSYLNGIPITKLFPIHSPAIVTARDWLAVAMTRNELEQRITEFIHNDETAESFRRQAARRTRSSRYISGNTRGWDFDSARRALAADPDWALSIQPCWYRAMDRRWILLHAAVVDWPRFKVTNALQQSGNLALVCRRQMVVGKPANYFWVSDLPVIDGIIRSDNRGSELVIPLRTYLEDNINRHDQPNQKETTQTWQHLKSENKLAFVYAQFCSTAYQSAYSQELYYDLPRVFMPPDDFHADSCVVVRQFIDLGQELINCHLLKMDLYENRQASALSKQQETIRVEQTELEIDASPIWSEGRIKIGNQTVAENVSSDVWNYRAGAHQIAKKWLRNRLNRVALPGELADYRSILEHIQYALKIHREIDNMVASNAWLIGYRAEKKSFRVKDYSCP